MKKIELEEMIESLEIQLKHLRNDFVLTKEEYENSIGRYLEILAEFKEKNQKLQDLQKNLEKIVQERTRELKESQKMIQEKSEEQQIMLDYSPAMIFYKDKNHKYVRVNKSFADNLGLLIKDIIGKTEYELFPEKVEQYVKEDLEILRSGKPKLNMLKQIKSSSGERWIQLDKIPYKDSDGNISGIIGFSVDVTESKRAEEERKQLEEQLFQSQKIESIGRLAGGIAHDFNNILTGIMGWAQILKIKYPDRTEGEGKAADVIFSGVQKAAKLTKQLLYFARSRNYNPITLSINNVIKDTLKVSEKIFEKNIKIIYEFEEDINTVEADKNQLDQVLTNLIINAKDAMPMGGTLIFKTENVTINEEYAAQYPKFKTGSYVKTSIADTGTGMSKDIRDRIFEPFFTTKEEGKGTGLGLATVYGIIKNHNGYISCESEMGGGTVFTIYLPASSKKVAADESDIKIIKGDATILIIDDEEEVRSMLKAELEYIGYKVILANDGIEGIAIYKEKRDEIDLILLDMIMPNMAGKETFYELKKIDPEVKTILCNGFSQNINTSSIIKNGVLGFIQKPFLLNELSKAINNVLKT